jgi:hypothetical protein
MGMESRTSHAWAAHAWAKNKQKEEKEEVGRKRNDREAIGVVNEVQ